VKRVRCASVQDSLVRGKKNDRDTTKEKANQNERRGEGGQRPWSKC